MTQEEMDELYKKKQFIDLNRVTPGLIPYSGIHYVKEKTKEEKRLDFERGTFNEVTS